MKKTVQRFCSVLGTALMLASHGAWAISPGQTLSEAQIAQLGALQAYDIGGIVVRALPRQANAQETLLLNPQGLVGVSQHEISITSPQPAEVQAQLQQTSPTPQSVTHYAPTGITVARYADFAQAVAGLQAVQRALPTATVQLSVEFGRPKPY